MSTPYQENTISLGKQGQNLDAIFKFVMPRYSTYGIQFCEMVEDYWADKPLISCGCILDHRLPGLLRLTCR